LTIINSNIAEEAEVGILYANAVQLISLAIAAALILAF